MWLTWMPASAGMTKRRLSEFFASLQQAIKLIVTSTEAAQKLISGGNRSASPLRGDSLRNRLHRSSANFS
jgi:hypothetical protein